MSKFGKLIVALWVFDGTGFRHIPIMKQDNITRENAQRIVDDIKENNDQIATSAYKATWEAEAEVLY